MQRFITIAMSAAVIAGSLALVPSSGMAQSNAYRNGQTTTGDGWMNENDYDYNRQHMTARDQSNRGQSNSYDNSFGTQDGYNRNNDPYRNQRRSNEYGQDRNYDQRQYEQRQYDQRGYDNGYNQRRYNNQQGNGRYQQNDDQD